jgi:hypothetical protein
VSVLWPSPGCVDVVWMIARSYKLSELSVRVVCDLIG